MLASHYYVRDPRICVGVHGPALLCWGDIDDDDVRVVNSLQLCELELRCRPGASIGGLDALRGMPQLVGLRLNPGRVLCQSDWDIIHGLNGLRFLSLGHDVPEGCLDLAAMPGLDWYVGPWWSGLGGLGGPSIRGLGLRANGVVDVACLSAEVVSLHLAFAGMRDLRELECLRHVRCMSLYGANRLKTLAGIERLGALSELHIERARGLEDISMLRGAAAMKRLGFADCPRVQALPALPPGQIDSLVLSGSTSVADGRLGWVCGAGIRDLDIAFRAHYDVDTRKLRALPPWEWPFKRAPSSAYRHPAIYPYERIQRAGLEICPDWFREQNPDLCQF